jgi:hypothetical protein
MWNSNSLTSWLLARTGHDMTMINRLPTAERPDSTRAWPSHPVKMDVAVMSGVIARNAPRKIFTFAVWDLGLCNRLRRRRIVRHTALGAASESRHRLGRLADADDY